MEYAAQQRGTPQHPLSEQAAEADVHDSGVALEAAALMREAAAVLDCIASESESSGTARCTWTTTGAFSYTADSRVTLGGGAEAGSWGGVEPLPSAPPRFWFLE